MNQPCAKRGLTLSKVAEDRLNVEAKFRRELFARPMNLRDDGVFPHGATLP
jgi:hypothetical protein